MTKFIQLFTLLLITVITSCNSAYSQCTFTSTNGYQVNISISPINVIVTPTGGDCVFKTELQYNIQFTGTNIPANLYTLQGNVSCFGQQRFFNLPNNGGAGVTTSANFSAPFINGNCAAYTKEGCTMATIIIQGPGIPYQEVPCAFVQFPNPLPIELIDFEAFEVSQGAELNWSTATERNNDFFTIEHSTDGLNFNKISTIEGAGNSSNKNDYSLFFKGVSFGVNYFRLLQTDIDGTTTTVRTTLLDINNKNSQKYTVFPNPTTERKINLRFNDSKEKQDYTVIVYSMIGEELDRISTSKDALGLNVDFPYQGNTFIIKILSGTTFIGQELIIAN